MLEVVDEYDNCFKGPVHARKVQGRESILILPEYVFQILFHLRLIYGLEQEINRFVIIPKGQPMQGLVLNLRNLVKPVLQVPLVLLNLLQHLRINQSSCLASQVLFRFLLINPLFLKKGIFNKRFDINMPLFVLFPITEVNIASLKIALLAQAVQRRAPLHVLLK